MSSSNTWTPVTRERPCIACGKSDWCARTIDGGAVRCMRVNVPPPGWRKVKQCSDGGSVFARDNGELPRASGSPAREKAARDWGAEAKQYQNALTTEKLQELATTLGVRTDALTAIGVGWRDSDNTWTFPERDDVGRIIGINRRHAHGAKKAICGGRRGVVIPKGLDKTANLILVVEGASDTAACLTMDLVAVGRASNRSSTHLPGILNGREILVLGENDSKPDGTWPGHEGAVAVARSLAKAWNKPVDWALPPGGAKDLRQWLNTCEIDLEDQNALTEAGRKLLEALKANANTIRVREEVSERGSRKHSSAADRLIQVANKHFRFGQTPANEPFAVARDGPNVARLFRGGRDSLRATLARMYCQEFQKAANSSAFVDAMLVLEGAALQTTPETVHLRVARCGTGVVLDLGTADGRTVIIEPSGWRVSDSSPVLFRRTELTAELPIPSQSGNLNALRDLINVTDEAWPLLVGWAVSTLLPDISHPIVLLNGLQGAGKSTTAIMIVSVIDPSTAALRPPPKDVEAWVVGAAGSWIVVVDNVSGIPAWWSDALCRASTGDGLVRRRLYTDSELTVLAFRRCVVLTSIDPGALRGDLGDRLLIIDLKPISATRRRLDAELQRMLTERRPVIFGGLLDLTVEILRVLPSVRPAHLPRMADFARVLVAVDRVLGTDGLHLFTSQRDRVVADVLESDPVAGAVQELISRHSVPWTGTAAELLKELTPDKPPKGWPANARGLGGRLRRLVPALWATGIIVDPPTEQTGRDRRRIWRLGTADETQDSVDPDNTTAKHPTKSLDRSLLRSHENPPDVPRNVVVTDATHATGVIPLSPATELHDAVLDIPAGWTPESWAIALKDRAGRTDDLEMRRELLGQARAIRRARR